MSAYYNEIDPYAAQWLRNLIAVGHIAPGDVDERSIVDVKAIDLAGYTQCHFFAGIGVWSYALRLAGWPDDQPVWTGSCPCQPFSAAGKRGGTDDERHLWPEFYRLIRECRPVTVLGEQIASKDGLAWLDLVHSDLESADYACGAVDLCAAGVGAPHIRQRLWFVADAQRRPAERRGYDVGAAPDRTEGEARERQRVRTDVRASGDACELADDNSSRRGTRRAGEASDGRDTPRVEPAGLRAADQGLVGNAGSARLAQQRGERGAPSSAGGADEGQAAVGADTPTDRLGYPERSESARLGQHGGEILSEQEAERFGCAGPTNGFWRDADWLPCCDGKARPVEPGTFPLAHGTPARVGRLRAYGNAINAEAARCFIEAYLERSALSSLNRR